jgi:hypothetical protein
MRVEPAGATWVAPFTDATMSWSRLGGWECRDHTSAGAPGRLRLMSEHYAFASGLCSVSKSRFTCQAVANEPYPRRASSVGDRNGSPSSRAHRLACATTLS